MARNWAGYDNTGHLSTVAHELFDQLSYELGYEPDKVMSIRMNPKACIVTWKDYDSGMPRSQTHLVLRSTNEEVQ